MLLLGQAALVLGSSSLAASLGLLSRGRWAGKIEAAAIPRYALLPGTTFPGAVAARGGSPAALVRAAVERIGGMERFVQRGETVLLKPNMAWDRTPEQGANTHPEIVAEVVRQRLRRRYAQL